MRVVMFLYSPFLHDSRVWREARTLASVGCEVRVIATRDGLPVRERDGDVEIVRVEREPLPAKVIRRLLDRRHGWAGPEHSVLGSTAMNSPSADLRPIVGSGPGGGVLRFVRRVYALLRWLKYC